MVTAKVKREIKRWPKSENEALRDDVAAGRRRLHIRSICPSPREATIASGVDNAAPPTGRHR
ncbi:TPA: lysis protein [Escherichia coli]|nr:lysis protein [Escherichia coli]HAH3071586.1 lysis protein [Escherichia coli]